MREIKFMVWDIIRRSFDGPFTLKNFITGNYPHMYRWGWDKLDLVFVQYTGLKDRNGKECYEGDIIKDLNSYVQHIDPILDDNGVLSSMIDYQLGFNLEVYMSRYSWAAKNENADYVAFSQWQDNFEIVGNIYQNPKLLELNNVES